MPRFHLAQFNIARMRAPLSDPMISGFVAQLGTINALADESPGFAWRPDGEYGSVNPYEGEPILTNLSVWESVEELKAFVYRSAHLGLIQDRRDWFDEIDGPSYVLWWVPEGDLPTFAEGKVRLDHLTTHGETEFAFSFRRPFGGIHIDGQGV